MANKVNHNKQYTAQDIHRYHSGNMNAAQMHALEKAALDDPFLADALEGYSHTQTADADLQNIRTRLDALQNERKVILLNKNRFGWMKIAAAVIFLIGAGSLFYYVSNDQKNELAIQDKSPASNPLSKEPGISPLTIQDSAVKIDQTNLSDVAIVKDNTLQKSIPASENIKTEDQVIVSPYRSTEIVSDSSFFRNDRANARNVASGPTQPRMNFFNGRVVDANNRGLSNATILMENYRAIITDNKGLFTIAAAKDSVLDATVNAKGYRSEQLKLANDEPITVVMKRSDAPLTEVVVLKKDDTKKAASPRARMIADTLEPAEGWVVFDNYISEKLKSKSEPQIKSASGEVALSFEINKNGEPVNITVEKSLCQKCDEEAVQLLKEGPKWKKTKNKKGKVTIKFDRQN